MQSFTKKCTLELVHERPKTKYTTNPSYIRERNSLGMALKCWLGVLKGYKEAKLSWVFKIHVYSFYFILYTRRSLQKNIKGHHKKILLGQARACLRITLLTHYFLIYSKTMTNIFFYPFINLFIYITNEVFVLSVK